MTAIGPMALAPAAGVSECGSALSDSCRLPAAVAAVTSCAPAFADDLRVTMGYQTNVTPAQAAISEHAYEKAAAAAIDWRKFDAGSDVVAALASGDVQIGYVGSSPTAAALSRALPIEIFYVA